jgi:hypothetical protein
MRDKKKFFSRHFLFFTNSNISKYTIFYIFSLIFISFISTRLKEIIFQYEEVGWIHFPLTQFYNFYSLILFYAVM